MTTTTANSTGSQFDATLANLGIKRTASGVQIAPASSANQTLGQGDFLKLMTEQMKNQDPFNPVDNTQMVAQMAQFSSLAGISEMGTTLKAIADKLGAVSTADALSYVGKTVLTEGKVAYPRASGGLAGQVELDGDATAVNLTITNAAGEVLKAVNLGAHAKGTMDYDWDGSTASGEAAGSGPFTVSVNAQNNGKTVTSRSLVWAPVTSVSMPSGSEPLLTLPGIGQVKSTAVRSIG